MRSLNYTHKGRYVQIAKKGRYRHCEFVTLTREGGEMPDNLYVLNMRMIGYQASSILSGSQHADIDVLLESIDAAVNDFFHDQASSWLSEHSHTPEDGIPTSAMDCHTPENTSILDALECCVDDYSDWEFQPERQHLLFAALAIFHLDKAFQNQHAYANFDTSPDGRVWEATAIEVIRATKALSFAENIRLYNWKKLNDKSDRAEIMKLQEEKRKFQIDINQRISAINSNNGRKGADVSHKNKRQLQEFAIHLYQEKHWKSASAAAKSLSTRIKEEGLRIGVRLSNDNATRTIADWFRRFDQNRGKVV